MFEKKKKARPIVEKTLRMWVHRRRYKVLVAEKRRVEAEKRRVEEEKRRLEEEKRKREEEEARVLAEAEQRRIEEAAARVAKDTADAKAITQAASESHKSERELKESATKAAQQCALKLQAADAKVHELEEAHDDVHAAVSASGGIVGVISMATEHAASSEVQAHFVGLMRDLCVSDEIADEIASAGGVEKILDAAHRHYDVAEVMMEVADSMRNLTCSPAIATRAVDSGAIEVLVDACARHSKDNDVSRALVGALWALSVHDPIVDALVRLGGVQAVLGVAREHPSDEDVQSSAAALIRNLAISENVRWCVAEKGGIAILLTAAHNFSMSTDSTEVASQVACALWNLAQTPEVANEIAASGAVATLISLAEGFANDGAVQLGVAGCLRLVCNTDAAADMVITSNGLPTLIAASRNHLKRADVQRAFVGALLSLAQHGFATTLVDGDAIPALLRVLESHAKEERLQARCANVVRLLAVDDSSKEAIGEGGGVGMLISAAKRFPQSTSVQADVAGALAVLAVDDALEAQIASGGGVSVLLDALQRHKTSGAVAAHGWHALTNLSVTLATKTQISATSGIQALIAATLQQHAAAPRVIEGVATTIRNMCDGVSPSKLVDAGATSRLVAALQQFEQTTLVALALAGAVRAIAADPPAATQLNGFNARAALTACKAAHKDDERLKKEVESALRRLDDAASGGGGGGRHSKVEAVKNRGVLHKEKKSVTPGTLKGGLSSRLKAT